MKIKVKEDGKLICAATGKTVDFLEDCYMKDDEEGEHCLGFNDSDDELMPDWVDCEEKRESDII